MVALQGGEHLSPALVPHDDVLSMIRHLRAPLVGNAHVADDEVGEGVCVVEAGVARGRDDVGELWKKMEKVFGVFFESVSEIRVRFFLSCSFLLVPPRGQIQRTRPPPKRAFPLFSHDKDSKRQKKKHNVSPLAGREK